MKNDRFTQAEMAEGKDTLQSALTAFKKIGLTGQPPFGARLNEIYRHYPPHKFQALVVAKRNGGWVADLVLCPAPKGVPDVLGTPDRLPFPTFEQAFEAGLLLLGTLLIEMQMPAPLRS